SRIEDVLEQIESVPKPTIALLLGATAGGGAAIALACDMRIAGDNLRFGMPMARTLGNLLNAHNLTRLMEVAGPTLTFDLIYTGRLIGAEEAFRAGLVNQVVPVGAAEEHATDLTSRISENAPLTLQLSKRMLTRIRSNRRAQIQDPTYEELVEVVYSSDDFREGIAAFTEHRSPRWKGS
ncbi:MAG: enoyl-CoA hydratase, partial [Acidimicrobiia bacterium]|nr:enoyl-CoA hydratase [Acidimicrobiia bacterium]